MNKENITPDTLPDEELEGGEGAVEDTNEESTDAPKGEAAENLDLSEINSLLGKDFPTKEAALKSIKDTYSHVGKRQDDAETDLKKDGYMTKQQAEEMFFFHDKPEHAENKSILEAIASKEGITVSQAAESDSYQKLFKGSAKFEEHQSKQSVMDSNPKVAEQKDKLDEVREMQTHGDIEGARQLASQLVMEAYGSDK